MEQLNRIELRGVVGSVRMANVSGKNVANFTMATSRAYTKKDNTAVIETEWHNVAAWEGGKIQQLDMIEKGAKLFVVGRLVYRKWVGSDGIERVDAEVQAATVEPVEETLSSQMS